MNGPNSTILGIYVGDDNQNKIPFKLFQNIFIKCGRFEELID